MSSEVTQLAREADTPKGLERARWTGLKTIIIREYGRIIRIWAQTIVPSAVTSALYFVIFGSLIGRRGSGPGAAVSGRGWRRSNARTCAARRGLVAPMGA